MKDLLVIVPTRGRPGNVSRQQLALMETRTKLADVLYAVDDDDPKAMEYARLDGVSIAVGPRLRLAGTLNFLSSVHASGYRYIGFMGDDHMPRTPFWDQVLVASMDARPGPVVAYGDDLFQGANLPTAVFMPSRLITAMGYMCPPGMQHLWLDNAWMSVGLELGTLAYLPEVVVEHMHPFAGKGEIDAGYREVNAAAVNDADRAAFEAWRSNPEGLTAAVSRIRTEYGL
jgi:hypothetical protein